MKRNPIWEVEADGVKHSIQFKPGVFKSKIIVDGETYKVGSSNKFMRLIDYAISFGSTKCNLVVIGNKVDLAVDGVFLESQKPYEPISGLPSWIWVLVGISCLGGWLIAGLFAILIGVIMSMLYIQLGLQKKKKSIIACFVGCTTIQILLAVIIFSLSSNI